MPLVVKPRRTRRWRTSGLCRAGLSPYAARGQVARAGTGGQARCDVWRERNRRPSGRSKPACIHQSWNTPKHSRSSRFWRANRSQRSPRCIGAIQQSPWSLTLCCRAVEASSRTLVVWRRTLPTCWQIHRLVCWSSHHPAPRHRHKRSSAPAFKASLGSAPATLQSTHPREHSTWHGFRKVRKCSASRTSLSSSSSHVPFGLSGASAEQTPFSLGSSRPSWALSCCIDAHGPESLMHRNVLPGYLSRTI